MGRKIIECKANKMLLHQVDPVNGFLNFGLLADPNMQWIIPNLIGLNEFAKAKGIRNLATIDKHRESDQEVLELGKHCMIGTPEAELIKELKRFNPYIMPKTTHNAFIGTDLLKYLKRYRPEVVVFDGVCTEICVLQTVAPYSTMAKDLGIKLLIIPMDCITTYGADAKIKDEITFNILRRLPNVVVIPSYRNLGEAVEIK